MKKRCPWCGGPDAKARVIRVRHRVRGTDAYVLGREQEVYLCAFCADEASGVRHDMAAARRHLVAESPDMRKRRTREFAL